MLGAIIGDIVGSRFEFHNHKSKNFELFTEDCRFTDDTVMTLAVAKAIQESKPDYSDLEEMAVKYMRQIGGHYPFCGYGGRFFHWMVCDDPKPYKSYGNGAAMRISACAEVPEADWETGFARTKERARKVTKVTHNHREGLKGAEAVAVASFMARAGVTKEDIKAYMDANYYKVDFTLDKIRSKYKFDVTCQGSVPQALAAFYESTDFEDAIRNAISIGGDSDTIAAITGAIAEQYYGIPARLQQIALSYLDDRLLDLYESFQEFRGIKYIDPESLEDGTVLCGLKQMFLDDVSVETFNPLAACLRDSIVKVPGNAIVSEADMQRFREGIKGGIGATFSNEDVITFVFGTLTINPLDVKVTITGNTDTATYTGTMHTVTGYEAKADSNLYKVSGVNPYFEFSGEATASRIDAGQTDMELAENQFKNTNDNFNVTFIVNDGWMLVKPLEVTVTITGHTDTQPYDGKEHSVTGYDAESNNTLFDVDKDLTFEGEAKASRTDVGTTDMGLAEEQFGTANDNFTVNVVIEDGSMTITKNPVEITVTAGSDSKKYDGYPLTSEKATVDGLPDGLNFVVETEGSITDFDEGTPSADEKSASVPNEVKSFKILDAEGDDVTDAFPNITFKEGTLTLTKRDMTLTSASAKKKYDGKPLVRNKQSDVTIGGDGLASTDEITFNITGSQTKVGKSPNKFTYEMAKKNGTSSNALGASGVKANAENVSVENNYNITTTFGTLTVAKNPKPSPTPDPGDKDKGGSSKTKTGDNSNLLGAIAMMTAALLGLCGVALKRRKEDE